MDDYLDRWWRLFGLALFFLFPVDLFLTLVAVARHGIRVEVNPLVRWLLRQGLVEVTLANLVAATLAVSLFNAVIGSVRRAPAPDRDRLIRVVTVWVRLVFAAGVVLTVTHLQMIV